MVRGVRALGVRVFVTGVRVRYLYLGYAIDRHDQRSNTGTPERSLL